MSAPPLVSLLPELIGEAFDRDTDLRTEIAEVRCGQQRVDPRLVAERSGGAFMRVLCRQPMNPFRQQLEKELAEIEAQRERISVVNRLAGKRPEVDVAAAWVGAAAGVTGGLFGLDADQAVLLGLGAGGLSDVIGRFWSGGAREDESVPTLRRAALRLSAELAAEVTGSTMPAISETAIAIALRDAEESEPKLANKAAVREDLVRLTANASEAQDDRLHAALHDVEDALGLVERRGNEAVARTALVSAVLELAHVSAAGTPATRDGI